MSAGCKSPVIAVEILDHLGAFKSPRADTAGENDHPCQERSKGRLHVRTAGPGAARNFTVGVSRQLPIPSREITVSLWLRGLPGVAFFQQSMAPPGLKHWHGGVADDGRDPHRHSDRLTARLDWLKKVRDEQYPNRGCARGHEDRTLTHGYTATREAGMSAFAKSWRREGMKMPRQTGLSNRDGRRLPSARREPVLAFVTVKSSLPTQPPPPLP